MLIWLQWRWVGLYLLLLAFGALTLFLYGFFPLKYQSGKTSHLSDLPKFIDTVSIDGEEVYNSGKNTVILMLIDGLRYDFVSEEYMPYTNQLIKNKTACIHVSVADAPTVTMPRIKAMMTGSASTFADVALNFGAPEVRGDSVPKLAHGGGRRSFMYGDDTWLSLFPDLWHKYEGTTSFFVSDYTEVDNNVTRNLDAAFKLGNDSKPEFDFLVLHYLGLDHIGHIEGARSKNIKRKLIEMDNIVKRIYTNMQKWNTMTYLFVCGDHGMRDAGGHGGSSSSEVLVPLVLVKNNDFQCPYPDGPGPIVAQVDVAPSISWLLRLPFPYDSTGRLLPALMPADMRQHLYLLHVMAVHNARQEMIPTDKEFYKQFKRAEKQFAHFLATGEQSAAKIAKEFYEESLELMSKYLTKSVAEFDLFAIGVAIILLYFICMALLCVTLYSFQSETTRQRCETHFKRRVSYAARTVAFLILVAIFAGIETIACFITETKSELCSFNTHWLINFIFVSFTCAILYFIIKTGFQEINDLSLLRNLNVIDYLLIVGTLFHAWSFIGTSFIEEEYMTWYFFWNTLMFFGLIRTIALLVIYFNKKRSGATETQDKPHLDYKASINYKLLLPLWVLLISSHRYLRTLNQGGDRWSFLSDTADWLNEPENSFYLQFQLILGTSITSVICISNVRYMNNIMQIHTALTILSTTCIVLYRAAVFEIELKFNEALDPIFFVNMFWCILIFQFVFEILAYMGIFKSCNVKSAYTDDQFVYRKLKVKIEDDYNGHNGNGSLNSTMKEACNVENIKLNLACSISHIVLNNLLLITVLLMRPHNVILVPSVYMTCMLTSTCLDHRLLNYKPGRSTEIVNILSQTLVHLWIGALFYFYQGNTNRLATVDLRAGYVGLSEYSPVRVASRIGLHTYAGPALAGCTLFCWFAANAETWKQYLDWVWQATNIFAFQRVYSLVIYCVIATFFRHHLFVWSVFSPKLLYDFVGTVFTIQALLTIGQIILLTRITNYLAKHLAR